MKFILPAIALLCLSLMSFLPQQRKQIKVYLIGDSTMAKKEKRYYPETGWGEPFAHFFDETVEVDNRAKNGESTKSFINGNRWQPVLENLQEGDYVFIQFGHNDEIQTKKNATKPEEFKANLSKFVTGARSKKAIPVLLTSVARRKFSESGHVEGTHDEYAALVRVVAKELQTPLLDMDPKSQALLQEFGVENSKLLYLQLAAGEHPNYPDGKDDNTHFSELGARKMAQLVLAEMKAQQLELADRIVKSSNKK